MSTAVNPVASMRKAQWSFSITSILVGPVVFLLCVRQWGTPHPWSRLNLYSGAFLVLAVILGIEEALTFGRAAFRSKEVAGEALGLTYDRALFQGGMVLNGAVLFVVLDYAHWHLVPALESPLLQKVGLLLGIVGVIWQTWADTWLARHFVSDSTSKEVMTGGPFRYVRHPRYAGFLVRKLAWPSLFASVIGWALLALWLLLVIRRMNREEAHLSKRFGADYEVYARRTARLVPGIY